ncbi:MAG: tetratricopeptide repeat protein, partial [Planctomycetota bacterium]
RAIEAQAEVELPSLQRIKDTTERARIDEWFKAADAALAAAGPDERPDLLIVTAELERARGNIARAIELSREGAQLMPTNSLARYAYACALMSKIQAAAGGGGVGALLGQLGTTKEFIREIKVAVELDPANHEARCKLIAVKAYAPGFMRDRGGAAELIEDIDEFREEFDRDFWRAQLLISDGAFDAALEAYEAMRAERPGDPDVVAAIGGILFKAERYREAAAVYDELVGAGEHVRNYDALYQGAKARELGKFELPRALELIELYEAADPVGEVLPTRDRLVYHKGVILAALGRELLAREALEESLEIQPGVSRVKKALAKLDAGQASGR